jgi:acetoacetyl-CoA reductase
VTGGTRGIGRGISIALKEAGYRVAANYGSDVASAGRFTAETGIPVYKFDVSDFDAVKTAVAEIEKELVPIEIVVNNAGNQGAAETFTRETGIPAYRFDVSDYQQCAAAVKKIEQELGPVEILVNNAGITRDAVLHRMTPEQWGQVIATNLTSCFNMCRVVIEGMRERGFGRIVNIGSINGQAGQYGQVNYAAAKSGIHGFTKALAQEAASRGVTVNAIAPGYIDTDMVRAVPANVLEKIVARIPVGRLGHAEEIARGVLFLVSDDGGFLTGSTMSINGGQHMY